MVAKAIVLEPDVSLAVFLTAVLVIAGLIGVFARLTRCDKKPDDDQWRGET